MTKQEEIREGIYGILMDLPKYDTYPKVLNRIIDFLHSQGVVIKVKCPDCAWGQFIGENLGMTPCYRCNSTGYIFEPLI